MRTIWVKQGFGGYWQINGDDEKPDYHNKPKSLFLSQTGTIALFVVLKWCPALQNQLM